jgi:hypothetical protein
MTRTWCALLLFVAACGDGGAPAPAPTTVPDSTTATDTATPPPACHTVGAATGRVPLTDLIDRTYLGFTGGLYPNCRNTLTGRHDSIGLARARSVQPLDGNGAPSAAGKIVLLSIGMSNTTQEFCSFNSLAPCDAWTFMGQAASDPAVNHGTLVLINGARGGQSANTWVTDTAFNYNHVRDAWLTPNGVTERQVQIAWVKVANPNPTRSLPDSMADAYVLEVSMGTIVRVMKRRYPNLQQIFFSSRIYGGYGTGLNPEPYAYESGLTVKWVIAAQIAQTDSGRIVDAKAGDLSLATGTPWLGWAAYLWADGTTARSDGLVWNRADIESDGAHPSQSGETKVGGMLLTFFKGSPYTKCWFLASGACP